MRRKKVLFALGLMIVLLGAGSTTLYFILRHQPAFYRNSAMPDGEERRALSREFEGRWWGGLVNSIFNQYPDWWEVFTSDQINGYLQEGFMNLGGDNNLPEGFHELRVQIEEGKLRLGCRYGTGFWSSILSIDVKMWLVAGEINLIGVEILRLDAGALPIPKQMILDYITEAARRSNIEATWYHREGNPVGILKLQADQSRPTIHLQRFELQQGKIVVVGRSTEPHLSHSAGKPASP